MRPRFYDFLPDALAEGEPFALGIISGIKGSSPQKKGAKALFFADGRIQGTLGGGCLEAEIQHRAIEALRTGQAATFDLLLDKTRKEWAAVVMPVVCRVVRIK